jgi:DNA-directed RNA polymerase subunit beta
VVPVEDMPFLEDGTPVDIILNPLGVPGRMNIGQVLEVHLGWAAKRLGYRAITPVFDGASEEEIEAELARAWIVDQAWKESAATAWDWIKQQEYDPESIQDDDEVRRLYLEEWLGEREYDPYELNDVDKARHATAAEWLRDRGYDPDTIFHPEDVDPRNREQYNVAAVSACLRLWIESHDRPGRIAEARIMEVAQEVTNSSGDPMPILGKQMLRDGKSGIPYDQPVTVGVMTVLKLHHLVEDKVHARSTGPYSLVTQQPLGGKAQFGGQRFGEMEVWALEAYGAAYTLQEMLTVKSDDVQGRVNTYEAIVKGEPIEEPSIPASFRVLVKELQSLGLAVEAINEGGDVVRFGKDEEKQHPPKLDTGLLGIGNNLMTK